MSAPTQTDPTTPAAPVVSKTEVTWLGGRAFNAGPAGRQHKIEAGGPDAPGPVETLLSAVATCSSIDIIDIIAKRKTPVDKLSVSVTAERRSEHPRRVMKMRIDYRIDGAGIEREHAERAMQLSFERYCSVAASLAPDIAVEASLTLNGETFPAVTQKVWSL
jgi:putative redox protein